MLLAELERTALAFYVEGGGVAIDRDERQALRRFLPHRKRPRACAIDLHHRLVREHAYERDFDRKRLCRAEHGEGCGEWNNGDGWAQARTRSDTVIRSPGTMASCDRAAGARNSDTRAC